MNAQKKENEERPVLYCVLEKDKNPIGCRLSATPNLDYLWLYYYNGVKNRYNVYKITDYKELSSRYHRNGFVFIEAKTVTVYNEVFTDYMEHRAQTPISLEMLKLPLAIQKNILIGRKDML